ncbi:MAG: YjgN family protein, partial [Spirochaetaceae bacterium]|nr:YjgN family protein [Spirochaetaceae bacterium]
VAANVTIWQINGTVLPTATEASHYYTNRFKLGLVTLLISLGIVLSLGLAAPYLIKKFSNYVFNRATFSGAKLAFNGNFSNFPKSIFVIFIILLVTAFIPEFLGAGSEDMIAALQSGDYQFLISAYGIHFVINLLSLLISAPLTVAAYKWWCSHTRIESIRPQETLAPTTEPVTV